MNYPAQAASLFMMAASRKKSPDYVHKVAKKLLETEDLTAEDIAQSISIIAQTGGNDRFLELLHSIEQNKPKNPTIP